MGDKIGCASCVAGIIAFFLWLFSDAPVTAYLFAAIGLILALVSKAVGGRGLGYYLGIRISAIVLICGLGFFLLLLLIGLRIFSMLG